MINSSLSPAAQAVLDAWNNEWSKGSFCHDQRSIAAALRAAARQLTPYTVDEMYGAARAHNKLIAIAAELESQYTSEEN
jgi:hypothetical protein